MLSSTRGKEKLGSSRNSSILGLIFKESNLANLSRFFPISLCNLAYKILTKIIDLDLKKFFLNLSLRTKGASCIKDVFWITLH